MVISQALETCRDSGNDGDDRGGIDDILSKVGFIAQVSFQAESVRL